MLTIWPLCHCTQTQFTMNPHQRPKLANNNSSLNDPFYHLTHYLLQYMFYTSWRTCQHQYGSSWLVLAGQTGPTGPTTVARSGAAFKPNGAQELELTWWDLPAQRVLKSSSKVKRGWWWYVGPLHIGKRRSKNGLSTLEDLTGPSNRYQYYEYKIRYEEGMKKAWNMRNRRWCEKYDVRWCWRWHCENGTFLGFWNKYICHEVILFFVSKVTLFVETS